MSEILHDDEYGVRVILLSRVFHFGELERESMMTFTQNVSTLTRIEKKIKKTFFTAEELDDITQGWLAYKTDQAAKEEAKKKAQQATIDQAYALAKNYPEISITNESARHEDGNYPAWIVTIPAIGWNAASRWSYDEYDLLGQVEAAVEAWKAHQEQYEKPIQEALQMARNYPAIKIKEVPDRFGKGHSGWTVSVHSIGWGHYGPVENPAEVLRLTKMAVEAWEAYQNQSPIL